MVHRGGAALCGLLCLALLAGQASGQFGMGKREEKKAPARAEDLPYIRCGVCEAAVKQSLQIVKDLESELKEGFKVRM